MCFIFLLVLNLKTGSPYVVQTGLESKILLPGLWCAGISESKNSHVSGLERWLRS